MELRTKTHFISSHFDRGVLPSGCLFARHGNDIAMEAGGVPRRQLLRRLPRNHHRDTGRQ